MSSKNIVITDGLFSVFCLFEQTGKINLFGDEYSEGGWKRIKWHDKLIQGAEKALVVVHACDWLS